MLVSYEVHVQGNIVSGRYIAGLIFISQQNLNLGQGTITGIDYDNGELRIARAGPKANRPRAPDFASLTVPFPAFAMSPTGQYCTSFMMPPPPTNACTPGQGITCAPDATRQAPFKVGDFIDFLGTLKYDSKGAYTSALGARRCRNQVACGIFLVSCRNDD